MAGQVVHLTTRKELIEFIKSHAYVIVKTGATWCGPCRRIKSLVEKLIQVTPDNIYIVMVDADKGSDILSFLKWKSLPTFGNFIRGELQDIFVGATEEGVKSLFNKTIQRTCTGI